MSEIVIHAEGLSKRYRIGARQTAYRTLRDAIPMVAKATLRATGRLLGGHFRDDDINTIWALKDVSFSISRGDVIGVIGRNGAGKSTLLKILSRITRPTTGWADVYGRLGALLEVGTGFHLELTGRENVYFNGAILGMKKAEIDRKFDEIVAFAEIDKFLDTPMKHYSSGMFVRLAFAVAAHLEPEILIVDEVLAVGDAAFQKKCLGKMENVAGEGRTVIFVGHNMATIAGLCSKAMVLKSGVVDYPLGPVDEAISHYLSQISQVAKVDLTSRTDRQGDGKARIVDFAAYDREGKRLTVVTSGQDVEFRIYYQASTSNDLRNVITAFSFTADNGSFITMLSNDLVRGEFATIPSRGYLACRVKKLPLAAGMYTVNVILREGEAIRDWVQDAVVLTVEDGDFFGTGRLPASTHRGVYFEQAWSTREDQLENSQK